MNVLTSPRLYDGHRVRVMWRRPVGIWNRWPLTQLHAPRPIYVFVAYVHGWERPVRICLPGDPGEPFVINDPLAYDGGPYDHGPHATSAAYDDGTKTYSLSDLFEMLHKSATHGPSGLDKEEQQALDDALEEFYVWIWREGRRDP